MKYTVSSFNKMFVQEGIICASNLLKCNYVNYVRAFFRERNDSIEFIKSLKNLKLTMSILLNKTSKNDAWYDDLMKANTLFKKHFKNALR